MRSSSNLSEKKLLHRTGSDASNGGAGMGHAHAHSHSHVHSHAGNHNRSKGPAMGGRKTMILSPGMGMRKKTFDKASSSINDASEVEVEFKHKEKILQPDKVYRFQCEGVLSREYKKLRKGKKTLDKEVKYRAEFSGNVEEFIYPSLRSQKKKETSAHQPLDFAYDTPSNDFSLHWKLDVADKPMKLLEDGATSTHMSEKGENTLRELLRKKYHERFSKEKSIKSVKDVTVMGRGMRKQNLLNTMFGERKNRPDTPDEVVSFS